MRFLTDPAELRRVGLPSAILLILILMPTIASAMEQPFYVTLASRMLILALAASGLNLVLGFGGMISFGHALYIGLGAYVMGIMAANGVTDGWLQLIATLLLSGIVAALTGAVSLRTSGMGFIMITLAFAQMFYFLGISLKQYGGDDGLQILDRSGIAPFSIKSNVGLYYLALVMLLITLFVINRLVGSKFGRVLQACKSNAPRMAVLGYPVFRYQLFAYVISGMICGVAGFLLANLTNFASPTYMAWSTSGQLIVMVMLGGVATVLGPLYGAILFILLETVLSAYTVNWTLYLGFAVIFIALFATRGLSGLLGK